MPWWNLMPCRTNSECFHQISTSWCWLGSLQVQPNWTKHVGNFILPCNIFYYYNQAMNLRFVGFTMDSRVGVEEALRHWLKYNISRCGINFIVNPSFALKSNGHVLIDHFCNFSSPSYHVSIKFQAQTWQGTKRKYIYAIFFQNQY